MQMLPFLLRLGHKPVDFINTTCLLHSGKTQPCLFWFCTRRLKAADAVDCSLNSNKPVDANEAKPLCQKSLTRRSYAQMRKDEWQQSNADSICKPEIWRLSKFKAVSKAMIRFQTSAARSVLTNVTSSEKDEHQKKQPVASPASPSTL